MNKMVLNAQQLIERKQAELDMHYKNAKTNTNRRASMFANKENRILGEIFIANLILNIFDTHGLKFLPQVNSKSTVEDIYYDYLSNKRYNNLKYPDVDYRELNYEKSQEMYRYQQRHDSKLPKDFATWNKARITQENIRQFLKFSQELSLTLHWKFESEMKRIFAYQRAGINNIDDLCDAIKEIELVLPEKQKKDPIKEKERALIGCKIPGFFPTPKSVVQRMVELADIETGDIVLEPSAGNGNIAEEIGANLDNGAIAIDVIELNHSLREILTLKGYQPIWDDFLDYLGDKYNKIVMNPPFEHFQDIKHVLHAYDILKPGGRIVAVMSESTFFRSDDVAVNFRDFLDNVSAHIEKVPEKAFQDKSTLRQTGVNCRIVVIDKKQESALLAG